MSSLRLIHRQRQALPSIQNTYAAATSGCSAGVLGLLVQQEQPLQSSSRQFWSGQSAYFSTTSTTPATSTPLENDQDASATSANSTLASSKHSVKKSTTQSSSKAAAYASLAKAKLSALVVATTGAGFVAAGGPITPQLDVLASVVVGTALCSSAAAAWNQIFEIDRDSQMKRTQQRPLVSGTLTKSQAVTAASLWGIAGTGLLAVGTDPVTTALGASNIVLYSGIYTYMKRHSIYNTWVGAVVGAIPPVMGWTAATGGSLCDIEALLLGGALYLWQMPHFFALSYMHRVDYARGGFAMVPCLEPDGERTANIIVRYAWYLSAVPLVATATQVTSSMFALEGIALNAYALKVAHQFQKDRTNANARKVFLTSLWYLPCWLVLFLLHSKSWDDDKQAQPDWIAQYLAQHIHSIRDKGRELCVHEAVVPRIPKGPDACPITVASRQSRNGVAHARATAESVAGQATAVASNTTAGTENS